MNIIEFIEDERFLNDKSLSLPQKVLLKSLYGESLDRRERRIFRHCTGQTRYRAKEYRESSIISGRRSGKSDQISSNLAIYEATMREHEQYLSVGETGIVLLLATSLRQARTLFNYVNGKMKSSKLLIRMIERETLMELELSNGITIAIYPCSEVVRGLSVITCILDEIAFFRHEGKLIDKEIQDSVKPSLITFPHSKLLKISSPSKKSGVLFNDYKNNYGIDSEILIWQSESSYMNPSISKEFVKGELKKDSAFARSEYLAMFKEGLQDFISVEALDSIIHWGRSEIAYNKNMKFFAFCDPSGGRGDDMTLGIAGREKSGQIIQVALRVAHPPFNPGEVVRQFSRTLKDYKIHTITGDRYSAEWVVEAFRNEGITYENSSLNKSEIYLSFLPLIMQKSITLLDNELQTEQFRQLERRAGRNQDVIDHPRNLKDDISNACAGSCVCAIMNLDSEPIPLSVREAFAGAGKAQGFDLLSEDDQQQVELLRSEKISWLLEPDNESERALEKKNREENARLLSLNVDDEERF